MAIQADIYSSQDEQQDRTFRAIASSRRRKIIDALRERSMTTAALCELFPDLDRCTVMKHLGALERAGLVVVERRGQARVNHLNPVPIRAIQENWIASHAKGGPPRCPNP